MSRILKNSGISEPSGFSGEDESFSQFSNVPTKDLQYGPIDRFCATLTKAHQQMI